MCNRTQTKKLPIKYDCYGFLMTPQQLYSTKNILWARGLSLQDIETVLKLENDIDVETEIFPFLDTAN